MYLFSGSMLEKLKDTGNVNGVILPGIKEGKWKVGLYLSIIALDYELQYIHTT